MQCAKNLRNSQTRKNRLLCVNHIQKKCLYFVCLNNSSFRSIFHTLSVVHHHHFLENIWTYFTKKHFLYPNWINLLKQLNRNYINVARKLPIILLCKTSTLVVTNRFAAIYSIFFSTTIKDILFYVLNIYNTEWMLLSSSKHSNGICC